MILIISYLAKKYKRINLPAMMAWAEGMPINPWLVTL
jgi:hypothetical protein